MKAKIDRDMCIGCQLCTSISPQVFEMDDEGISTVVLNPIPEDLQASTREAADSCPVEAIIIEE